MIFKKKSRSIFPDILGTNYRRYENIANNAKCKYRIDIDKFHKILYRYCIEIQYDTIRYQYFYRISWCPTYIETFSLIIIKILLNTIEKLPSQCIIILFLLVFKKKNYLNENTWKTEEIFSDWLFEWYKQLNRKILLLIDIIFTTCRSLLSIC